MYNYHNSSILYVSPTKGDDYVCNGLAPVRGSAGDGPFKTLKRALKDIEQRRVCGHMRPMTIMLTEDLFLREPMTLKGSALHALSGVTIDSYGERKRIVGGIKINHWQKDIFNGVPCISAQLPSKEDGEPWFFTDLFVNGRRAQCTRFPENGTLKAIDTEKNFTQSNPPPLFASSKWVILDKNLLKDLDGIENATLSFKHYWADEHTPIESYDRESGKLTLRYPSRFTVTTMYEPKEHASAFNGYLENLPSAFKHENDWYLDRQNGKVYYIPADPSLEACEVDAYAPTMKHLLLVEGTNEERIADVHIRNLEFMCSTSDYVSKYVRKAQSGDYEETKNESEGFASDVQSFSFAHGAILFRNAQRCSIQNCLIRHIGTHAVEIKSGCRHIRLEENTFDDIGGGAIKIWGGEFGCPPDELTGACLIRKNVISSCGKRFASSCGILICHASDNEISDNEISHIAYSGISVGWTWGYADNSCYGNLIKNNHIHHIGEGNLSDLGGIYLLGKQMGTIISHNRIHDVDCANYGGYGIYTDEGTSYVSIEDNTVYKTKSECLNHHYGCDNVLKNNIFAFGGSGCVRIDSTESHDGFCIEGNIFITDGAPVYTGWGATHGTMYSKNNLIYDISGNEPILFANHWRALQLSFEEWITDFSQDAGSVYADPLMKDVSKFDFTLSEDSPALKLGFKPFD